MNPNFSAVHSKPSGSFDERVVNKIIIPINIMINEFLKEEVVNLIIYNVIPVSN
jgi:hypothetical protein